MTLSSAEGVIALSRGSDSGIKTRGKIVASLAQSQRKTILLNNMFIGISLHSKSERNRRCRIWYGFGRKERL